MRFPISGRWPAPCNTRTAYLTEPGIEEFVDDVVWIHLGEAAAGIAAFHKAGVSEAVMAGKVMKTRLYGGIADLHLDARAIGMLGSLADRKDDSILGAVVDEIASEGIEFPGSSARARGCRRALQTTRTRADRPMATKTRARLMARPLQVAAGCLPATEARSRSRATPGFHTADTAHIRADRRRRARPDPLHTVRRSPLEAALRPCP